MVQQETTTETKITYHYSADMTMVTIVLEGKFTHNTVSTTLINLATQINKEVNSVGISEPGQEERSEQAADGFDPHCGAV